MQSLLKQILLQTRLIWEHISHRFEYPQDENLQYLLLGAQYQASLDHPSKEFAGKTLFMNPLRHG